MSEDIEEKNLDELLEEADEIFSLYYKFSKKREDSKPLYKKALEKATKLNKKLEMEYILGKIDLIDKKFDNAIKRFDKALEINKSYVSALNGKGVALGNLSRYEEALKYFDKALELESEV